MKRFAAAGIILVIVLSVGGARSQAQDVPPVDWSSISPSDFTDEELDLPYYLEHFHTLANSVRISGPTRGFIDLAVWREAESNGPYNARIMENVVSLAFFYTANRPWNPYYGHPAVRTRLEYALDYWVRLQNQDGSYTHSESVEAGMSATAFATKFMGETLRLLSAGPSIDAGLFERVRTAQRKAIMVVLTRDDFYASGRRFSNQYTNVWGGVLAYLDQFSDPNLRRVFERRFREALDEFQSPAGYFYEHDGPDWVYDIETHHSNHRMAWHYLRGSELGELYSERVRAWYEWLADNAVIEPDGSGFTMNHGMETRLSFPFYRENRINMFGETCSPLAEVIEPARAFCESEEERQRRIQRERAALERSWPNVAPLEVGTFDAYSPYAFLHRAHYSWYPSTEQKRDAKQSLPYVRSTSYAHTRSDDRHTLNALFVRRPSYYAAFTSGERLQPQQRYGLGLLWHPEIGAVLQSPSDSDAAWGTVLERSREHAESGIPAISLESGSRSVAVRDGVSALGQDEIAVSYALDGGGQKRVVFRDDEIVVTVEGRQPFVERIPLLAAPNQQATVVGSTASIQSSVGAFEIRFTGHTDAILEETGRRVGPKRSYILRLESNESLTYSIRFEIAP